MSGDCSRRLPATAFPLGSESEKSLTIVTKAFKASELNTTPFHEHGSLVPVKDDRPNDDG